MCYFKECLSDDTVSSILILAVKTGVIYGNLWKALPPRILIHGQNASKGPIYGPLFRLMAFYYLIS